MSNNNQVSERVMLLTILTNQASMMTGLAAIASGDPAKMKETAKELEERAIDLATLIISEMIQDPRGRKELADRLKKALDTR